MNELIKIAMLFSGAFIALGFLVFGLYFVSKKKDAKHNRVPHTH
jgi:hypothetical protein